MKIVTGMFGSASNGLRSTESPSKTEQSRISGAVSPAARATASTVAVRIPPSALGRITVEHRAPAADPERVGGFAHAVRDQQQHLLAAAGDQRQLDDRQRHRAGEAGLRAWWSTSRPKTKRPMMIEGRPFIRSSVSRIGAADAAAGELGQVERDQDPERHRDQRSRSATIRPVPTIAGPIPVGAPLVRKSRLSALGPARDDRVDDDHQHRDGERRRRPSRRTRRSG